MRVQNVKQQSPLALASTELRSRESDTSERTVFQRTLTTLSGQRRDDVINAMVNRIDEQGRRLISHIDIAEFARYRALIKEFIEDIVSNGYEFSKDNVFDKKGRHRFLVTVNTVDEKLDLLAKEILSGQADNLDVLHAVDDIRGLIFDLFA